MNFQVIDLKPLNSGGNADLYIGQRDDTGERVVVKYLREWQIEDARKAFAREVRVLARALPGLIALVAWDTAAKRPYYVMPYVARGALTQYARRLNRTQLHGVATDLACALASIHSAWEVHGDFKPDNILVGQDGRLQVADPLGNGTVLTMLFSQNRGGTPGYWAPEIRAGGPISRAGDVYSYGATLYHILTGSRPRDGQRFDQNQEAYVNSPKTGEIIRACCQFDCAARPTMQEVLQMLRGERWADILAARKQRDELVGAAFVFASVLLLGVALTASRVTRA